MRQKCFKIFLDKLMALRGKFLQQLISRIGHVYDIILGVDTTRRYVFEKLTWAESDQELFDSKKLLQLCEFEDHTPPGDADNSQMLHTSQLPEPTTFTPESMDSVHPTTPSLPGNRRTLERRM